MATEGIMKTATRWVALGALFLIPITPLLVADTYFFPFITGKAFYFRILVEVAVVAWAVLASLDKEYRPRYSLIGVVVFAFVGWMFIADAFAINAAKAFWSNFERMEGWVLLAHLLGFFVAAGAVLRVEKKWRAWFLTSLVVSLVIAGYALLQLNGTLAIHQGSTRIDATLGNSAYLAIYFLFNVFIALWLALTERYAWLKWSLIAIALLEGVLLFFTETRGTVIGLIVGLALASLLTALTAGKRARSYATAAFIVIAVAAGGLYVARDSAFVQENHVLARVASVSSADGQTRFTLWRMAFEGMQEHPIVGWGQEGFNYIFNKYYDPSLYQQEQWFDRAHNAFIDWLTAGGIPAFLLYLALFGGAIAMLWRNSELSRPERIALTAALVGYAVHNIFVFDNLYSYVYFFAILALIDSQVARPLPQLEGMPELSDEDGATSALPIALVVLAVFVWGINVPGMQAATNLIIAISPSGRGIDGNIAAFKDVAAHPAFAAQEVREQLVSFAASIAQNQQASNDQKEQAVTLAVQEIQKQIAAYPLDAREQLQLAYLYRAIGDDAGALKQTRLAQALSPKKEGLFIEIGSVEWNMGNTSAAQAAFNKAYELGPAFSDLATYAAAGDIAVGDTAKADALLQRVFGTTNVDSDILAVAYYRTKNWPRLIALWKTRAEAPGAAPEKWFSYAAAYYAAGDKANALITINKAVERYPSVAADAAVAIKQIEGRQ